MQFTTFKLVEKSEGCRLKAYPDTGGVMTIGYGHTHAVYPGMVCTQTQADQWLLEDMAWAVRSVNVAFATTLHPPAQGVFDALYDFVYNVGGRDLPLLSPLAIHENWQALCDHLIQYVHDRQGHRLNGLVTRRKDEIALIEQAVGFKYVPQEEAEAGSDQ